MKWFRFYTETLDDIKILQLTDYEYRMWTYLMAYACEVDSESGDCRCDVTSLSIRCRTRVSHLKHAIETFQKLGIVSINESGNIVITNWSKRQFKSDNVYERVKKHREVTSKRNVSMAVSETPPDTDTDTEKTLCDRTEGFEEFYQLYPLKRNPTRALKSWAKAVKKGNGTASAIMDALSKQIAHKAHLKSTGAFCPEWPHPSTWLNDERWKDEIPEQSEQRTDNSNTVHSVTCPACKRTVLSSDMQGAVCILCAEVTDA